MMELITKFTMRNPYENIVPGWSVWYWEDTQSFASGTVAEGLTREDAEAFCAQYPSERLSIRWIPTRGEDVGLQLEKLAKDVREIYYMHKSELPDDLRGLFNDAYSSLDALSRAVPDLQLNWRKEPAPERQESEVILQVTHHGKLQPSDNPALLDDMFIDDVDESEGE